MPFLSGTLSARGALPAVATEGRTLTYRALDRAAEETARRLLALGVRPGDGVALKGHPDAAVIAALHGIWKAGGVVFPLNPRWTPVEEERALALLRPRLALSGRGMETVEGRWERFSLEAAPRDASSLEALRSAAGTLPGIASAAEVSGTRIAAVLLTSGTSGAPRSVPLTFGNLVASAAGARERLHLVSTDRWLASLSMAHVGGLALVSRAAFVGSSLLLEGTFQLQGLVDLLSRGRVTHASLVPTMLHRLLEAWGDRPVPDTLRCLLIGGAAAERPLLETALARGFPLALTYGLTEATSQVATAAPDLVRLKPGTAGPPLPGVEVRIGDGEEILVRGPTVAPGQSDEDGWLHTGDLGRLDTDGHLWVTGRLSHRIISGGVNVDPEEVEAVIRAHPGVQETAVVGIPDPEWGERVVAALVAPGPGVLEEIEAVARDRLSPAKRPRVFRLVDALPRNANGKVDREAVRALFVGGGEGR